MGSTHRPRGCCGDWCRERLAMNIVFDFGGVLFCWQPHEFIPRLLPQRAHSEAATNALVSDFFQGYSGDWGDFDRGAVDEARLVQHFGITLRESVFIDDFALNVAAARALGWQAIHFLSGAQCEADLARLGLL